MPPTKKSFRRYLTTDEKKKLILLVRQNPCLWNSNDPKSKKKLLVERTWCSISEVINFSVDDCKYAWKLLKSNKYYNEMNETGQNWMLCEDMSFLPKYMKKTEPIEKVNDDVDVKGANASNGNLTKNMPRTLRSSTIAAKQSMEGAQPDTQRQPIAPKTLPPATERLPKAPKTLPPATQRQPKAPKTQPSAKQRQPKAPKRLPSATQRQPKAPKTLPSATLINPTVTPDSSTTSVITHLDDVLKTVNKSYELHKSVIDNLYKEKSENHELLVAIDWMLKQLPKKEANKLSIDITKRLVNEI